MFHQDATHEHLVWNCAKICILILHTIYLQNAHVCAQKSHQISTLYPFRIRSRDAFKPKISFLCGGASNSSLHGQFEQQPMTWEDAFNFTTISYRHNEQKPISIGSWNVNALLSHVQQAAATPCDILAIQEVRICKERVHTVRAALRSFGYNLYHGTLPQVRMQGSLKRSLHVDQLIPGVAFLIQSMRSPKLLWKNGMKGVEFLLSKFFSVIGGSLSSVDMLPYGKAPPTLMTWPAFYATLLIKTRFSSVTSIKTPRKVPLRKKPKAMDGFPSQCVWTMSFALMSTPKGGQSAIDTIIVSDSLKEMVSPLDCLQIFNKGHKLIHTNFLSSYNNVPTWETSYAGKPVFEIDSSSKWQSALDNFLDNSHHTSIDSDWSLWCHTFQKPHNSSGSVIGDKPAFRIRDVSRKNKLLTVNQLRKWQKRMNPRGQLSHDWSRHLFKWAKDPQPPIPSCIASNHFGCNGFTTSVHESLREISHYFQSVYRSDAEQQAMEVPPGDFHYTCDEFERIFAMTKQVIAKANTSRVSGLDGLEVAHLKQLPEEASKFIAHIFAKALSTHRVPQAWLNCKMSCIPKKPGKTAVKDLRPLTIAQSFIVLFVK